MKQKYLIFKGNNENELIVQESGELDKGIFMTVFEGKYNLEAVKAACKDELKQLINALRTPGFYPIRACAEKIAKGVIEFFKNDAAEPVEIYFNDMALLKSKQPVREDVETSDDNPVELDELLEDESKIEEDDFLADDDINAISSSSSSLKIADDESMQADEEV